MIAILFTQILLLEIMLLYYKEFVVPSKSLLELAKLFQVQCTLKVEIMHIIHEVHVVMYICSFVFLVSRVWNETG